MKAAAIIFLVFVLAPATGIALTYLCAAFLAWDWLWVARTGYDMAMWRFLFLTAALFVGLTSMIGACSVAAETVD